MTTFENKVVLVTGSSHGVGAAIANGFARHGAHVVVHGRDQPAIDATRTEIERVAGRPSGWLLTS